MRISQYEELKFLAWIVVLVARDIFPQFQKDFH